MLCDYGCGQEATHQFKNGKGCCKDNSLKCPGTIKKIISTLKHKKYIRYNPSLPRVKCNYCDFSSNIDLVEEHEKNCCLNPINTRFCLVCGTIIKNNNLKTCSRKCAHIYFSSINITDIDSKKNLIKGIKNYYIQKEIYEIENNPFEKLNTRIIYKILYTENGNKCQECGYEYTDEKTGKGPFEIHHIDGNNKNWKKDNLKILCLNCHWKTPGWRFRGKHHSEDTRKKISLNSKKD